MKKILLGLTVAMMGFSAASAESITYDFVNNLYGQERYSGSVQTEQSCADGAVLKNSAASILLNKKDNTIGFRFWSDGMRVYKNSDAKMTVTVEGGVINSIDIAWQKSPASSCTVNGGAAVSMNTKAVTLEKIDNAQAVIAFTMANNTGINSLTINYTPSASGKEQAGLAYSAEQYTVAIDKTPEFPTLANPNGLAVTYSSSEPSVATVDANGAVTLVAPGTTVISAESAATDKYYAGNASYTLTVQKAGLIYSNACTSADCGFESELVNGTFNPWVIDKTYGLKASGYKSGASNASDAIMYSPVLNVPAGKVAVLNFEHALNQFKVNGTLMEYTQENVNKYCKVVAAKVVNGVAEKVVTVGEATISAEIGKFDWGFFPNAEIELPSDMTGDIIIGFHYISTAECAGTWEIKNVEVTLADGVVAPTAAEIVSIEALSSDNANVAAEYDAEGDVWALIGDVKVASDNINVFTLQVNVAEGAELWYYAAGSEVGGQPLALAEEGDSDLPPLTQSTDGKIIVPAGEGGALLYTKRNGVLSEPVMLQYYVTVTKDSSASIVEVIDGDGDAEVYDLMGRRINNAKGLKGLYIVNGKKMILR